MMDFKLLIYIFLLLNKNSQKKNSDILCIKKEKEKSVNKNE